MPRQKEFVNNLKKKNKINHKNKLDSGGSKEMANNNPNTQNQAPKAPKTEIKLRPELKVDSTNNTFNLLVECSVFSDGKAVAAQQILVREGVNIKQTGTTDINGSYLAALNGTLTKAEQNKSFRFCLAGLADEAEVTVSIPAETPKPKTSNDPESTSLYRYHDGQGNFRIFARVLREKGYGIAHSITFLYKGQEVNRKTNNRGETTFNIPGVVKRGEDNELLAVVDGIKEVAKVKIRRPAAKKHFRKQKKWLFTTNNGRGILLLTISLLFWLFVIWHGFASSPIISADCFRDSSGLSTAEQSYNEAANLVGYGQIKPHLDVPFSIPGFVFVIAIPFTFFAFFYMVSSWREEIFVGIEEGINKIVDRDHDRIDDPRLEKWMKYFGMKHTIRNPKVQVSTTSTTAEASTAELPGHPGLATLFQLDLMSDVLVAIVPKIFKNVFGGIK